MKYVLFVDQNHQQAVCDSLEEAKNIAEQYMNTEIKPTLEINSSFMSDEYVKDAILAPSKTWTYDYVENTWTEK
jgi:hypothetical protein